MKNDKSPPLTLIVDDDPGIRLLARRVLEAENWTVLEADGGAEALRLIATEPRIGMLITDVVMPGMSGIELVTELRAMGRWMPVLYLTGYSNLLFTGRQILGDGEAFLSKPFSRLGLLQAAHQVVAMHHAPVAPRHKSDAFVFPEWYTRT